MYYFHQHFVHINLLSLSSCIRMHAQFLVSTVTRLQLGNKGSNTRREMLIVLFSPMYLGMHLGELAGCRAVADLLPD
jgi:hypothetical protein